MFDQTITITKGHVSKNGTDFVTVSSNAAVRAILGAPPGLTNLGLGKTSHTFRGYSKPHLAKGGRLRNDVVKEGSLGYTPNDLRWIGLVAPAGP